MSRKKRRQLEVYAMVKEGILTLVEAASATAVAATEIADWGNDSDGREFSLLVWT